jgi:hypothetical protein
MTVTAGDTITCEGVISAFSGEFGWFNDATNNAIYDTVYGGLNGTSTNNWVISAVYPNSAGGSITPQINGWPSGATSFLLLACQAWKGTRSTFVVDPTPILFNAANASNPTAGTAVTPTNINELIVCQLSRASAATTSAGSGFSPAGTLTAVTENLSQYFQYQIQTAATAVNCPYTSASAQYTDTQFALLNAVNPAGYRPLGGMYGFPASAQTNGATATLAILNTSNSGSIWATHGNPTNAPWTQYSGATVTFDTSVNPTGTGKIMVNGKTHTFGDAGGSVAFPNGNASKNAYLFTDLSANQGTPMWLSYFFRAASAGATASTGCDTVDLSGGIVEGGVDVQAQYTTGGTPLGFFIEPAEGGHSPAISGFSADTDYWIQIHSAGVNERYHQVLVSSKSGGVWSLSSTLNFDALCAAQGGTNCTTPATVATGSGTVSSGSNSLVLTGVTGTVSVGNVVLAASGSAIPYITTVAASTVSAGSGTVTLSQNAASPLSAATVNFIAKPANLIAATTGTVSAGSTAMTIVVPGSGTVAVGQAIGSTDGNIQMGTVVAAVSGTSVTLNQAPAIAESSGVSFWRTSPGLPNFPIGTWSSCAFTNTLWYSGVVWDPLGTWGQFEPN